MESIGTFAGGVAHDFNNILSAITGYGHLTLMKMAKDDPVRLNVENMLEAADRAAHLTQDLLLFSRKQITDRKPVDLNGIVRKVEKFLKRVIGEDIECKTVLQDRPLMVLADAHQIEQVLMNFATNARDAMPTGGTFTITVGEVRLDDEYINAHGYGRPGTYALVTISDSGKGMDSETRLRIFEPFFTTKELGKGTGLGLAVVYGIVKQHEGYVNVYSEPGKGTTFRIYLPEISASVREGDETPEEEPPMRGTETILLAEDDKPVRNLVKTVLEEYGYKVIAAVDGEDAVNKYRENRDKIELLLFDLIMPKKTGKEAYDEIGKIKPDIKIIYSSGYAPDIIRQRALVHDQVTVAFKPLSPKDLLKKVRSVLDGGTN
jgi:CheY-like chemotaxis protein/two-component sensor histidine kinase